MAFPRMFNASTNSARVAFITGCATPKSIGRASALLLAQNGAKIVATDMPSLQGKGEELVAEIKKAGGDAVFVPLDVTKETEWQSAMEKAEKAFGPVDVVFNNAGIYPESNVSVPIWEQPTALYDKTMDVNVKGVYFGIKYGAKSMIKRGTKEAASIVNTSSIAGIGGNLGGFAYTMSKHAVVGATKHAAIALAPKNIRVNSVHPGVIHTTLLDPIFASGQSPAQLSSWAPIGRMATPEEVAAVVLFLAGNESSYVSGAGYVVDGGLLAVNGLGGGVTGGAK